jgi:hypothetical protein
MSFNISLTVQAASLEEAEDLLRQRAEEILGDRKFVLTAVTGSFAMNSDSGSFSAAAVPPPPASPIGLPPDPDGTGPFGNETLNAMFENFQRHGRL